MDVLSTIAHSSSTLIGWSITILGGTFLAILSSSFNRPSSLKFRLTYFLFIPGWTCRFWSIKKGDDTKSIGSTIAFVSDKRDIKG